VKSFPAFYATRRVITVFKANSHVLFLSQMNPVHNYWTFFFLKRFNNILVRTHSYCQRSRKIFLPKFCWHFPTLLCVRRTSHHLRFYHPVQFREKEKLSSWFFTVFLPPAESSWVQIFFRHYVFEHRKNTKRNKLVCQTRYWNITGGRRLWTPESTRTETRS
jgi:hypothetical protein